MLGAPTHLIDMTCLEGSGGTASEGRPLLGNAAPSAQRESRALSSSRLSRSLSTELRRERAMLRMSVVLPSRELRRPSQYTK